MEGEAGLVLLANALSPEKGGLDNSLIGANMWTVILRLMLV